MLPLCVKVFVTLLPYLIYIYQLAGYMLVNIRFYIYRMVGGLNSGCCVATSPIQSFNNFSIFLSALAAAISWKSA